MEQLLSWELGIVEGAQSFASPILTTIMRVLSFSGTEYFYLAILPLVYWCIDKRRGFRLGFLLFFSTVLNLRLKLVFAQPRPYDLVPALGLAREDTFGLPSNHAQGSTVLWGSAAPLFRAPWGLILAIGLPLLVGISRIYLGVHFPTDVLAGWIIGAALVVLDRNFGDRIEHLVLRLRQTLLLALVTAVALGMSALNMEDTSQSGAFFGLAMAAIHARKRAPFSVAGTFSNRSLRYLFGLGTVLVVYALPKLLLADLEAGGPPLIRFLRFAVLGAWVGLGAPWLFLKMGLAKGEDYSANENEGSVISK